MPLDLLEELKNRPDAVLLVNRFQSYLKEEAHKRRAFYDLVHENVKAEFINGEIVLHSPVRMQHLLVSSNIAYEMLHFINQHDLGFVGIEKMMIELSRNCYEPDIVFFRKAKAEAFSPQQKLFPSPDLVVEILSESTRENDYGVKFKDYAAHGVEEYWIVDAEKGSIEQYFLEDEQFVLQKTYHKGDTLVAKVVQGLEIALDKVMI